jgi:signal transduction histidine kinase
LSVLVDVAVMRDAPGLHWLLRDITERKRMEKELEQRNRDLLQLYRVSQTLTATLDLQQVLDRLMQGITEIVNAQATSVWLWDRQHPDELVCRAAFYPGAERLPVGLRLRLGQCFIGWVAQNGKSVIVAHAPDDPRFDPAIDRHTGLPTTSLLAAPLRVRDVVIGVLQVVNKLDGEFDAHDLTLIETLSSSAAIAIDNAQLVEAQRQFALTLQARNEELGAYGHTVAHDLKNPAALIISYAEVLDSDGAALSEPERRQSLQAILRGGLKMIAIIDDLLLLASVRQKSVPAGRLDMRPIVSEAAERLAPLIKEHQAELVLPPWGAWPTAKGYAPWVEEVWVNYISNALKYGGTPSAPPRVELGGEALPDGMARFWVRDNGPGLTPEEQARLFTPFTRVGQAHASGHGLGLSIVRRIVERLGGQVHVQSAPGQGSVFSFTLPGAHE